MVSSGSPRSAFTTGCAFHRGRESLWTARFRATRRNVRLRHRLRRRSGYAGRRRSWRVRAEVLEVLEVLGVLEHVCLLAIRPRTPIIAHAPLLPPRDRRVAPRGAARPPQADAESAGDGIDHRITR